MGAKLQMENRTRKQFVVSYLFIFSYYRYYTIHTFSSLNVKRIQYNYHNTIKTHFNIYIKNCKEVRSTKDRTKRSAPPIKI